MYSSSAARVPEPGSRTMNPSSMQRARRRLSRHARSGCSTDVTSTCGCIAKGSARVGQSFGGRPMTARSTLPSLHERRPLRRGCSPPAAGSRCPDARRESCASSRGRKYLRGADHADVQHARSRRPRKRATMSSASAHAPRAPAGCRPARTRPTMVSETLRLARSNSGRPTSASSSLICMETAGGVRSSSSAARAKLECRATAAKTRSCRRVAFFIKDFLS